MTKQSCMTFSSTLKLEIVVFTIYFALVIGKITSSSLIIDKVCLGHLQYPSDICSNLGNYSSIKLAVEKLSTNYQLAHTLFHSVPSALLACCILPWSDRYGRKLPVLLTLAGFILDSFGSLFCAFYLDSRVEYFFIPTFINGLSGGSIALVALIFSMVSDFSALSDATMKYSSMFVAMCIGYFLGTLAGGWIFGIFGYVWVFFVSCICMAVTFLLVLFFIPESRGLENKDTWRTKYIALFSCKTLVDTYEAVVKERPQQGRKQLLLMILSLCVASMNFGSTGTINFLYVHHQFGWGNTEYSTYVSLYAVLTTVLILIIMAIFKRYRISDPCIGLVGSTSLVTGLILMGLAFKPIIFHAASTIGTIWGITTIAIRSRISKVVNHNDIGKVFSFVSTSESFFQLICSILISQIFNVFLGIFPGTVFLMLAVCTIIPFSVFIWLRFLPPLNFEEIHGKKEEKSSEEYAGI